MRNANLCKILILVMYMLSSIWGSSEREISDLTMLLPISISDYGNRVAYNITAYNGCYEW